MNNQLKQLKEHQAELITAVIGAIVMILVTAVPGLKPYQEALTSILLILASLILGISIKKGLSAK